MDQFYQVFSSIRQQKSATASRTDILRALIWPASALMVSSIGLVAVAAPFWMLVVFILLLVSFLIMYLFTYIYSLFNNPDSLRSERYSLEKMAIERGVYGDSVHGLTTDPKRVEDTPIENQNLKTLKMDKNYD